MTISPLHLNYQCNHPGQIFHKNNPFLVGHYGSAGSVLEPRDALDGVERPSLPRYPTDIQSFVQGVSTGEDIQVHNKLFSRAQIQSRIF